MKVSCPHCRAEVEAAAATAHCGACGSTFAVGELKTAASDAAPADPLIGTVLGGCKLLERVGAGGMGVVYKAEQLSLGRIVAVKVLSEEVRNTPGIEERFQREIAVLARLSHPNIVSILDGGCGSAGLYFIMEHVDGVSLRRVLATGGMRPDEALRVIPQICDALEYAHARGVVHRDIKPENILIDRSGRIRLLDFGLSRLSGVEAPESLTRATQVLGTFEYMAPEQREASRAVDHRADLYSLGVVIYEMLTGELPIGRFDAPSKRNIQIDVRLDDIVLRVLDKSPDRRYQHASEIKTEVERVATPPAAAAPQPPAPQPAPQPAAAPPAAAAQAPPPPPVPEIPAAPSGAELASALEPKPPTSRFATIAWIATAAGVAALALTALALLRLNLAAGRHASANFAMILFYTGVIGGFTALVVGLLSSFAAMVRVVFSGGRVRGIPIAFGSFVLATIALALLVFCSIALLLPSL